MSYVTYPIKYQCVVFRPYRGEIFEAVVTVVNKTSFQSSSETQKSSMESSDFSETEMSPSLDSIIDSIAMSIDTPSAQLPPPQLGSTRLLTLAMLAPGQKFHLGWDEENNPIGILATQFASYCGYVVRCEENIPLTIKRWSEVPDESINKSLEAVMKIFDYEQADERLDCIYNDFSIKFCNYQSQLRKEHYLPHESDSERLAHLPKNVSMDAWKWLVNLWCTNQFNTRATGKRPKRMRVYTITHRQKIGVAINKDTEETINKVEDFMQPQSDDPDAEPFCDDEAFDVLFPPSRNR